MTCRRVIALAEDRGTIWERATRPDRKCTVCKGRMVADRDGWRVCPTCDGKNWTAVRR